jgi:radical SAM-linked protein
VGRARFISHLELIEVFARALRRADLPVAFSGGHHPQPRLRFSPGLPVGAESECEVIDVDLSDAMPAEEFGRRFGGALPEGLEVIEARLVSLREPSPDIGLSGFRYRVSIAGLDNQGTWIDDRLAAFAAALTFPVRKRTPKGEKEVDARALVTRLERIDRDHVELDVRFTPAGSIKPSDVLASVLAVDGGAARALPLVKTHAFYEEMGR